jgi:hypothetical protein
MLGKVSDQPFRFRSLIRIVRGIQLKTNQFVKNTKAASTKPDTKLYVVSVLEVALLKLPTSARATDITHSQKIQSLV